MSTIIKDGILDLKELKRLRISKAQLFAILRQHKIYNLGEVERAYWEACGICSVYKYDEQKPGLPVMPEFDSEVLDMQQQLDSGMRVCSRCGHIQNISESDHCQVCNSAELSTPYKVNKIAHES